MAWVAEYNGKLYKVFHDPFVGYTRRTSLKMDATRENWKRAKREVALDGELGELLIPYNSKVYINDLLEAYFTHKRLKPKTILIYKKAVDHFISAAGDRYIYEYNHTHYVKLLNYFKKPKQIIIDKRKKKPKLFKDVVLTQNSQSMYTRHLKALFNYF